MKITNLFEDRGVSPVIGVVLMVAITVILAATVGVLLIQFGENATPESSDPVTVPSAEFSFDDSDSDKVTITYKGASNNAGEVTGDQVHILLDGTDFDSGDNLWSDLGGDSGELSPGDSLTIDNSDDTDLSDSDSFSDIDKITVSWESEDGDKSGELDSWEA